MLWPAPTPSSRGRESAGRWLIFDTRRALTLTEGTLLSPSNAGRVIPKWTSEVKTIWMTGWVLSAGGTACILSAGEAALDKNGESSKQIVGKRGDLIPKNNGYGGVKGLRCR